MSVLVVAVGGEKGGVGKTTIAVHVCAFLAAHGLRVLLIDTEARPSTLAWLAERPEHLPRIDSMHEKGLISARPVLDQYGFDAIVIDVLGGDSDVLRSAMEAADVFVSPFKPSQLDLWKARWVAQAVAESRQKNPRLVAFSVVNEASPYSHSADEAPAARALLGRFDSWRVAETVIYQRRAFRKCFETGLAVHEMGRKGTQAADEMGTLLDEVGVLHGIQ